MIRLVLASLLLLPSVVLAQTSPTAPKIRVLANVNYTVTSRTFEERSTFTAFLEDGSTGRNYDGGTGIGFEVGAIYSITPELGVMGSFETMSAEHDASFDITAPHPLFFNQPRNASDDIAALEYKERALNVDAVYTLEAGSLLVDVFGGMTMFFTETELVDEITTSSVYPFDDLEISSTATTKITENPFGFNVGAALTYRFTPVVGASFQAKFSRAAMTLQREAGEPIDINAGGFRIGGGIRLTF